MSNPVSINILTTVSRGFTDVYCDQHISSVWRGVWWWSYKNTKILRNLFLHFAKQDGQNGKKGKKVTKLKWPKYQRPKDENMGWTKHKIMLG